MRVLLVHNYYQQPGGEDLVFAAEAAVLREHGHEVLEYVAHNDAVRTMSALGVAAGAVWSRSARRAIGLLVRERRPDVVHFHNTFPLISPAAYSACVAGGAAVVQTLHNYRLVCPGALLLRNGRPCTACVGHAIPWAGVAHGCYRGSRAQSAAVAAMLTVHRAVGTWSRDVDVYVALTEFARAQFVAGGLPADRIVVKPNFVATDPGARPAPHTGSPLLFAGRLSREKGVDVLLRAWELAGSELGALRIAGAGPLMPDLPRPAAMSTDVSRPDLPGVTFLGHVSAAQVATEMRAAGALVFPSVCFENFPLAVAEAFACGTPVIASRIGAVPEIVADGVTGLLFAPGDAGDLAAKLSWARAHPEAMREMGHAARRAYELNYTAARGYERLLATYAPALARARQRRMKHDAGARR